MPLSLNEVGAIASILVLVILILCYYNKLQLCCKVVNKEGYESNPVVGAAVGNAANRAAMRSDGYGADVSGLAQASQDAVDQMTRAGVVMGLSTSSQEPKQGFATYRSGFQGVMGEPPVFWNQGSLEDVAEYENNERMNMPTQSEMTQSDMDASYQNKLSLLNNQAAKQLAAGVTPKAAQGFRALNAY
jgi:hypothetical protein